MARKAAKKKAKPTAKRKPARAPARRAAPAAPAGEGVDVDRVVRAISARFTHAIPAASASAGAHVPTEALEARGVPDGKYRVAGSDWILTVESERVTLFQKAYPDLDPAGIREIAPELAPAG